VEGDVSDIDIVEAGVHGGPAGALERLNGRGRQILHAIRRMKPGKVNRHVRPHVLDEPRRHLAHFLDRIVQRRDNQHDDLRVDPDVGEHLERVEHGRKFPRAHVAVKRLGERLEVDLDGRQVLTEFPQRRLADVTVRDGDAADTHLPPDSGRIVHVLVEDDRLGVGVGDGRDTPRPGNPHEVLRRHNRARNLFGAELADLPVLAELALHIAAGGRNAEGCRPRQIVKKRLLLNRVHVEAAQVPVNEGFIVAAAVFPDAAVAPLDVRDDAFPRTERAPDGLVLQSLEPHGIMDGNLQPAFRFLARCRTPEDAGRAGCTCPGAQRF